MRGWVVGHLDRLGVTDLFDAIVTRDDVTDVKPDPELYLLALARLGLEPHEAMVFEDAPNGVLAAKRADLRVAAGSRGHARRLVSRTVAHRSARCDRAACWDERIAWRGLWLCLVEQDIPKLDLAQLCRIERLILW
jgi:beta-phosphoglucomutase-like phosphatase (HAD superfamily)